MRVFSVAFPCRCDSASLSPLQARHRSRSLLRFLSRVRCCPSWLAAFLASSARRASRSACLFGMRSCQLPARLAHQCGATFASCVYAIVASDELGDRDLDAALDPSGLILRIKGKPPEPKKMRINSDDEEETDTEAEES
jgi:hypothetical protein